MRSLSIGLAAALLFTLGCPERPKGNGPGNIIDGPDIPDQPNVRPPPPPDPDLDDRPINETTFVDSISPPNGAMDGGYRVRIDGRGFTPTDLKVFFGDVEADQVLFLTETIVSARVPPCAAPGPVDVRVESTIGIGILEGGFTCFSPVTLLSIAPEQGSTEGGTDVTVTGEGFTPEMLVLVGGRQVINLVVESGTRARFTTPPGAPGRVSVDAFDAFGASSLDYAYSYVNALALDAVTPNVVDDDGSVVELTGAGFGDDVVATIGGRVAQRVNHISEARLRVRVPTGLAGPQDVEVTSGGDSALLEDGLVVRAAATGTFSLVGVVPARGDVAGGTALTLIGEGLSSVTGVTVGGAAATNVVVVDDGTVTLTAPAGVVGPASIVATRADASTAQLDRFRYFAPVVVSAIAPARGGVEGGTAVTITGRGFSGATRVRIGALEATDVVVVSDSEITATTPAGSSGSVDVVVARADETGRLRNGFLYEAPLAIIGVRPSRGAIGGNTFVTVTGGGFSKGPVTVTFEGRPATEVTVVSDNVLHCRTPVGAPGRVDVGVAQGDEVAVGSGLFTYFDPTSIAGGPRGGPIDGAVYLTALDAMTGFPIPGLIAFVGTNGEPIAAGVTNLLGQATISGPDVVGPQTVSVVGDGYSYASFVDVDASEMTVYLFSLGGGPPGGGQLPPPPPPATIRGRVFGFAKEFFDPAALDQSGCPPAGAPPAKCEIAFAEVNTTTASEFSGRPPAGGANVVFEEGGEYFIANSRPGRLAVVALAGIYDINNDTFRLRQLGVRREVFPQFGVNLVDQDIELTIPLDENIDLSLPDAPLRVDLSQVGKRPSITRVIPFLQFGGEGTFVYTQAVQGRRNHALTEMPKVPGEMLTFVSGAYTTDGRNVIARTGTVTVTAGSTRVTGTGVNWNVDGNFDGVPDVLGGYFVITRSDGSTFASAVEGLPNGNTLQLANKVDFSGSNLPYHVGKAGLPSSEVIQDGVGNLRGGVTIQPVLGLPELLSPTENGVMVDRTLRWKAAPGQQPSIHDMFVYDPFFFSTVWEFFVDGARSKVVVPVVPSYEAILRALSATERPLVAGNEDFVPPGDLTRGGLFWQHESIFVPSLDFRNWSYLEIGTRGRRSWTTDVHALVHGD